MKKPPIYIDPPKTGKKIAAGAAAGAGVTALVVSLSGNGDVPPETTRSTETSPSTTLVTREPPRAAFPVLTERAATAHSASSAVPPILDQSCADKVIRQQQRVHLPYALEQFKAATHDQNDPKRAYESLLNVIEYAANTAKIDKGSIASIPEAVLQDLGTTRTGLQTLFERQSLEYAQQGFQNLKSDPTALLYDDVKNIRRALENTAYPTPEAAAQAIFVDGKHANYPELLALEDKLKAQLMEPHVKDFKEKLKSPERATDPTNFYIALNSSLSTIINLLDDGRSPPPIVEEQFKAITGMSRKEMGDFMGKHWEGHKVQTISEKKADDYQRGIKDALTTGECWTQRTAASSQQDIAGQPRR